MKTRAGNAVGTYAEHDKLRQRAVVGDMTFCLGLSVLIASAMKSALLVALVVVIVFACGVALHALAARIAGSSGRCS